MRKSTISIIVILLIAAGLFALLWYLLNFNFAKNPMDLIFTIIWWVVIILICFLIYSGEKRRQRSIRTAFIAPDLIYNSEAGIVDLEDDETYVDALQEILMNLDYGFEKIRTPNKTKIRFKYIVNTNKFANSGKIWRGEVIEIAHPNDPREFKNKRELSRMIDKRF